MSHNIPPEGTYLSVMESLETPLESEPETTPVMAEALNMAAAMMRIAKDYNVRHISPVEIVEMSSRLYDAGVIGLTEYAALSFQPELSLEYNPDEKIYKLMQDDPDRPRDFIAEWERHIKILQRQHPDPFNLKLTGDILELLQCFEPFENDDC